jgi:hypothetical protein
MKSHNAGDDENENERRALLLARSAVHMRKMRRHSEFVSLIAQESDSNLVFTYSLQEMISECDDFASEMDAAALNLMCFQWKVDAYQTYRAAIRWGQYVVALNEDEVAATTGDQKTWSAIFWPDGDPADEDAPCTPLCDAQDLGSAFALCENHALQTLMTHPRD